MSFFIWSQFTLVCLLGAMSPGPSLALIIYNSVNKNRTAGIVAAIAHGLGIFVYATVTVVTLDFILQYNETIFFIIQILGSVFLIFLGLIFLFQSNNNDEIKNDKYKSNAFTQGFVIAIINPKILVWFVAIYSQFITLNSNFLDSIILILTPSLIDAIWYSFVAVLVTSYGLKDILYKKINIIKKIIGTLLILIALTLIYSLINF
tara:strand:+ start:221 stop:835 length:615 start_codon:yes stop_codon:yes gene_type:complete